ncbi:MAG: hypothetical protein DRN91_05705 [Candidatus Alkanophagales archaeon]|nr:MAG: hypothetical protein DRN91_05705 [Candidatus Alkanophagales archaeon]
MDIAVLEAVEHEMRDFHTPTAGSPNGRAWRVLLRCAFLRYNAAGMEQKKKNIMNILKGEN